MIISETPARTFHSSLFAALLTLSIAVSLLAGAATAAASVADTAEAVQPVAAGETAPAFNVRTVEGKPYHFDPAGLERPVILILFRGGWCPYCNLHLSDLRHVIPEINELGVDVLFLSGDRPDILYKGLSAETQEEIAGLDYQILSDADAHAAEALGVAFRVDATYIKKLDEHGADTRESTIERRGILPVPAVIAIGTDGIVAWSRAIPDYQQRVAPEIVLEVAQGLVAD
jgi:peroxiredoxin